MEYILLYTHKWNAQNIFMFVFYIYYNICVNLVRKVNFFLNLIMSGISNCILRIKKIIMIKLKCDESTVSCALKGLAFYQLEMEYF